jgi:hypothetical protein
MERIGSDNNHGEVIRARKNPMVTMISKGHRENFLPNIIIQDNI